MRLVRSLLLAALTACSAGVAHAGGGGHRAPVWLLVALTVIGTPVLYALSRARWRFAHLVAVMGLAQLALHVTMTLHAGSHVHHEAVVPSAHGASVTMAATHVGVTVLLAAALAYGERALAWVVHLLVRASRPVPYAEFAVRLSAFDVQLRPSAPDVLSSRSTRAPPVIFAS